MLFVVLYLGFFVVSVPAAVIATLKGRWWLGVLGYLGFVGTILGVSESPLLSFWPWTGVWAVGLTLLIVGVATRARSGSWWDRRAGMKARSGREIGVVVGSLVSPVIWIGWLLAWGFDLLPLGPIFG